jgi:hypothetical protein
LINITSEEKKFTFEVQVGVADTVYKGIIWTDNFLDAQWGEDHLNRNRKGLIEQLVRLKKEGLVELSTKYELSKTQFSL